MYTTIRELGPQIHTIEGIMGPILLMVIYMWTLWVFYESQTVRDLWLSVIFRHLTRSELRLASLQLFL